MPLPEHSCRLAPPGDYREFARKNDEQESEGKTIDVIYGIKMKDGKRISEIQSLRYSTEIWTEDQALGHCETREGTFEPAEPEVKAIEPKLTETHKYAFAWPLAEMKEGHLVDIEILREGSWAIKKAPGGVLALTKAKLEEFVKNFQDQVVGEELPLDIDHEGKTVGWLKTMWINAKDGLAHLWARLDITDSETQKAVKEGSLRYFSPSLEMPWVDPETNESFDVIRAGALTNWPFIKNMKPAIVNFSEIRAAQETPNRKEASLLLARDNEIINLKRAGKVVIEKLIQVNSQLDLRDKVILKLEMKARIDNLVSCGDLSPFEGQEMRKLALSEPKSVGLTISLLKGRGKAWHPGQQSIITQRRRSSVIGLTELQQAVDREKDPERHSRLLEMLDNRIGEMKQQRGIK